MSKALCVLVSTALVTTQFAGCAQAPKSETTALPTSARTELHTRSLGGKGGASVQSGEIVLFGRLEIVETGNHARLDLSYDAALFLTADNAPNKPIPLWPASEMKWASEPFSPAKDGRFQIVAPAGNYGLQVVYRSYGIGWIAIDPGVRILAKGSAGAVYVGNLRVEIDPQAALAAKTAKPSKQAAIHIQVADDYSDDYAALKFDHPQLADLPVTASLMSPDSKLNATAILSTNRAAESKVTAEKVALLILTGVVLIPLFAAFVVLAVVTSGSSTFKFGAPRPAAMQT